MFSHGMSSDICSVCIMLQMLETFSYSKSSLILKHIEIAQHAKLLRKSKSKPQEATYTQQ